MSAGIDRLSFASRERWARLARERPGAVLTEGDIEQGFSTFAGADERFISTAIVAEDLATLQAAATPVRKYTNTVIAHRQRKSGGTIRETVTFGEINEALETVGRVARKYYRLRQPGVELAMLTPVVEYGFLTMFKEPWYRDGLDLPSDQDEG
jgi:hypothetical protein